MCLRQNENNKKNLDRVRPNSKPRLFSYPKERQTVKNKIMRIEVKVFGEKNISWQVQPEAMQAVDLNNNKTYVKNIFFDKKKY